MRKFLITCALAFARIPDIPDIAMPTLALSALFLSAVFLLAWLLR